MIFCGFPLGFLLFPSGFHWFSSGFPFGFLWVFRCCWFSSGPPIVLLCLSCGFRIIFPMGTILPSQCAHVTIKRRDAPAANLELEGCASGSMPGGWGASGTPWTGWGGMMRKCRTRVHAQASGKGEIQSQKQRQKQRQEQRQKERGTRIDPQRRTERDAETERSKHGHMKKERLGEEQGQREKQK